MKKTIKQSIKLLSLCLLVLLINTFVIAISIETDTYKIECTPENSTIQSIGYKQTCENTLKIGEWKGDIAYCFDTTINGKIYLYNTIGTKTDITNQFSYKHYNIQKGECYYISNVLFNTTKIGTYENGTTYTYQEPDKKTIDIIYTPNNYSKSPKWDTYFGDINTNRIDLKLDPLYNTNTYKIGTTDSTPSYYWQTNGTNNPDIQTTTTYITEKNITNLAFSSTTQNLTYYNASGSTTGTGTGLRIVALQDTYITSIGTQNGDTYCINLTTDSGTLLSTACGDGIATFSTPRLLTKGTYYRLISAGSRQACNIPNSTNLLRIISGITSGSADFQYCTGTIRYIIHNSTTNTPKTTSNYTSNNITLGILVNSFNITSSYTGVAFINITFDNINYYYMNLSNNTITTLTDNITDNNKLSYKLYLNTNTTTINNITINFNGYINQINITIKDETTGQLILQNITVTLTDLNTTTQTIGNTLTGNIGFSNIDIHTYEVKFTSANYTLRKYILDVPGGASTTLTAYLTNNQTTQNIILTYLDENKHTVIENVLVTMYGFSNGTQVPISSGYTDTTGRISFVFIQNNAYSFYSHKENYADKLFTFNPILYTTANIYIQPTTNQAIINNIYTYYTPKQLYAEQDNTFKFIINSPENILSEYNWVLTAPCINTTNNNGIQASGELYTTNININTSCTTGDNAILYYNYTTIYAITYQNQYTIPIIQTPTNGTFLGIRYNTYGLGDFERTAIVTVIVLIVAGIIGLVSGSTIISMSMGLLIIGYFSIFTGFINATSTMIVLIIGAIFILAKGVN